MRLLAVCFAALAVVAAAVAAAPRIQFPRDHYGHRAGIEWWYVTGDVRGSDGHRYSVFFTLFKRSGFVLPVSQVVDLDTGARVGHTEITFPALVGGLRLNILFPGVRLRYTASSDTWLFHAASLTYSLTLTAKPEKPYVLHGGGTGQIRQADAVSAYYSATRMTAQGTIRKDLRSIRFTGTAWFDHQWGNFPSNARALSWDWFSCRFDDRTELMLYRFRDGTGNGTFVDPQGHARAVGDFEVKAGTRILRRAGGHWPVDWTMRVPSLGLKVQLRALVRDQLVLGRLLPTFWEGASDATGTKRGTCFVEETK